MDKKSHDVTKTTRRSFAKTTLAALAMLAGSRDLLLANGQMRRSKRKPATQRQDILQTSPITIGGGGSVSIDFKHSDYLGASGKYSKANDEIEAIWVYTAGNSLKWDLSQFVFRKDCSITVHTKKGSSSEKITCGASREWEGY